MSKGLNADTLKHNCNQWKEEEVKFFLYAKQSHDTDSLMNYTCPNQKGQI